MKESDFRFSADVPVRFSDADSLGHVNNAVYLSYFEEARVRYFAELLNLRLDDSPALGIIVLEIRCTYRTPAYCGETMRVYSKISWMKNKSMEMQYLVAEAGTGRTVADGSSILVAYDYPTTQTIEIPENVRIAIAEFEGIPRGIEQKTAFEQPSTRSAGC